MTLLSRFAILALLSATPALELEPGPPGAPTEAFPKPDRPVAGIVSPHWAHERRRTRVDEDGQVVRAMAIKPGETDADIGAGSGYYTFRLANVVGPTGPVLAENITPDCLAALEKRVARGGQTNIAVIRGAAHDSRLALASVDAAVLIHMSHETDQPFGLLHNVAAAMKAGGRVGIVDSDDIPTRHGTPPKLLRCELAAAGTLRPAFAC